MGDIFDDFVRQRFGLESYERVERGLHERKKQRAMSMFNDKTKGRFIFLIDSRACVPSIKLSSVDVIIIYGSDWNPTNDLRVLKKISIESQSEHVPIFRLYSSCTVEEKALILAKHDHNVDSNIQNINPISSHSLLSWGASFLFSRLEKLKNNVYSSKDSHAEELFMDKVILEYLTKLSTEVDASTKMNNAAISQAHLRGPSYSSDSAVVGEREGVSAPDGDLQKFCTFWVNLLDGKSPRWQYITEPGQRCRRKIQNMEEGKIPANETGEGSMKRRKNAETLDSSANVVAGKDKDSMLPEIKTTSSSQQISVDDTWQEQGVENLQGTQKGLSGEAPTQILQLEMQPSVPREVDNQTDLIIQSAQPSMVPAHHSEGVEQAALSRVPSAQRLLSGMQPSIPVSSVLVERTHFDRSQQSNQPEDALGSSAQLFSVASILFNHPPVGDEPLKNELHRLRLYIDSLNKTHELKQSQLRSDCSQEIEKVKQKYDLLLQEQESTHFQQRKTLDGLCEKVLLNQSLADDFRAKFISSSGAQGRAHSPVSQQVLTRPSAVASIASHASSSASRPPVRIRPVQTLHVDRPSSSSPSPQMVRPHPSAPGNLIRSTSVAFSHTPVLPRGSFGVQSELARAPAPHLQRRLSPRVHSMAPANQPQLPTRLECSTSARAQSIPVTPVNIGQSSLHPCSNPIVPAPLCLSSSHPAHLPSPGSLVPNPALQLTSPPGFTRVSSVSSVTMDVLPSRRVGPSPSGTLQSDSDSVSLDGWLIGSLGLSSDPRGSAAPNDVVCLSDDE
uniref:Uncharacterized protein n=1 Tax=Avena sativa TaxID=4498 RepID=A0ACD5XNT1_AVESA